jgi:hypothetical protein
MKSLFVTTAMALLALGGTARADALEEIRGCFATWKQHPFSKDHPKFKTITSKVKVMGIGSNVKDDEVTAEPALVLVRPAVAVMSKQTLELLNPNGWYCLKNMTTVMGKGEVRLHCKARLASSEDGASVAAVGQEDVGGTAVLGKVNVIRVGCDERTPKSDAAAAAEKPAEKPADKDEKKN